MWQMGFSLASRGGSPAPPRKYPGHKNPAIFAGYGHIGVACFGRSDRGDDSKRCEQEKQPGGGEGTI